MDIEATYARLVASAAKGIPTQDDADELALGFQALDEWMCNRQPDDNLPKAWASPRYRVPEEEPPVSLGEQAHDPADCFMYRGRPHLGACMDAEAYTRWYWLDGPGSKPFESTQIALATARLVAEAFDARERRKAAIDPLVTVGLLEETPEMARERAWAAYHRNHPEVVASWGEQNGRWPSCPCCSDAGVRASEQHDEALPDLHERARQRGLGPDA
jgi:hypothetical protein